jgi:hypothetical protein
MKDLITTIDCCSLTAEITVLDATLAMLGGMGWEYIIDGEVQETMNLISHTIKKYEVLLVESGMLETGVVH